MSKKDLANVTADLSALASMLPTQRPSTPAPPAPPPASAAVKLVAAATPKPAEQSEEVIQFSLSLRKDLRKQLSRLADEADMTMRAFVLNALKAKGLDVRPDDLLDLRKDRR
jgi:hypothetical protein